MNPAVLGAVFASLVAEVPGRSVLRQAITAATRVPEPEALAPLLPAARLAPAQAAEAHALALRLATGLRARGTGRGLGRDGLVQGLLQEFSLSSQEGVALMCLAEALLRIPDAATRDALIRDKLGGGRDWAAHLRHSGSLFVNAATWGLLISGRLVATHDEGGLLQALARLVGKGGEPLVRKGVDLAMRLLGEQFVAGQHIGEALARARAREAEGFRHSYDMLGEAALTEADAQRYLRAYEEAIHAIGRASSGRGEIGGPGISIKLSALHPRYSPAQRQRVLQVLYPRLRDLAVLARRYHLGLNIDAEEADRLELSLDLLERLCAEPALAGWPGLGFVVQAYQKRCPLVIDWLIDLARRSHRRLMVRLVKGAYWDSEIKRAQVEGLDGYPVYTRKAHTDVSYLACARRLLAASDAVYPQFATHNAHTVAAVHTLAGPDAPPEAYEFQCLHGMGEPLYEHIVQLPAAGGLGRPCRIYAPVGTHETLLAYLVRRLLENGANTSFVNRMADEHIALEALVEDPVTQVDRLAQAEGRAGLPHPAIPLPRALYGEDRLNSRGLDLANEQVLAALAHSLSQSQAEPWIARPLLGDGERSSGHSLPVRNPADHGDVVDHVVEATTQDVADAVAQSVAAAPAWQAMSPRQRAEVLDRAAGLLEDHLASLVGLMVREAGKTLANAVGEVREATDFLRYYALQLRQPDWSNDTHRALGPLACISPWNFPLAIFTGQVAAALAAGNTVLAKPAEQTPLVAAQAVRLLRQAGVPTAALQLLPGPGDTVGAALVADARIRGVLFTGSTEVARLLQRSLAGRLDERGQPLVLVAETGGLNAMIVDSSALPEQVVADVLTSAFDSAGQRCSALRLLCLQADVADAVLAMLKGALHELAIGRPDALRIDIGPVIDEPAREAIEQHVVAMRSAGHRVYRLALPPGLQGTFVAPTVIELNDVAELTREVFGPVLHVVRYPQHGLAALVDRINASSYGLTMGLHTRIDETLRCVSERARVGNLYVNRHMVGAVVGVQPFGGEGLSGTGPKAGGPLTLLRLLAERPAGLALPEGAGPVATLPALSALRTWLVGQGDADLAALAQALGAASPVGCSLVLPGPTGERNSYTLVPREAVLSMASQRDDLLVQLIFVLAADSRAVWPGVAWATALWAQLPPVVQARIAWAGDAATAPFDAALISGTVDAVRALGLALAQRPGPLVALQSCAPGTRHAGAYALDGLLVERAVSVNTAAAGGNASLMTLG